MRETRQMQPGAARERLAHTLNSAYGAGLLSEHTLVLRLDALLSSTVIDPVRLVGDLTRRAPHRTSIGALGERLRGWITGGPRDERAELLALDWNGGRERLLIGRHHSCDVVLGSPNVSRRHARLDFRDGTWILRDLDSTNGTRVNGATVGRCTLRPGDRVAIGAHVLTVD
jgi:hypothetical protein